MRSISSIEERTTSRPGFGVLFHRFGGLGAGEGAAADALQRFADRFQVPAGALDPLRHFIGPGGDFLDAGGHFVDAGGGLQEFGGGVIHGAGHLFQGGGELAGDSGLVLGGVGEVLHLGDDLLLLAGHGVDIGAGCLGGDQSIPGALGKVATRFGQGAVVGDEFVDGAQQLADDPLELGDRTFHHLLKRFHRRIPLFATADQRAENLHLPPQLLLQGEQDKGEHHGADAEAHGQADQDEWPAVSRRPDQGGGEEGEENSRCEAGPMGEKEGALEIG